MKRYSSERLINTILIASLSVVPLIFVPVGEFADFYYAPKVYAITALAAGFLLILLLKERGNLTTLIYPDRINITLLLYIGLLTLSLFFARDFTTAFYGRPYRLEGFGTLLIYFLLFLAARSSKWSGEQLFRTMLLSATILSVYGILQYFGVDPFPRDFIRANWQKAFSTFGNPNFLGSYLVMMLPVALHQYINKRLSIGIFIYALLLFCLLCTRTMGAWMGGAIACVGYLLVSRLYGGRTRSELGRILLVVLVSAAIALSFNILSGNVLLADITAVMADTSAVVTGGFAAESAGSHRIFIWSRVITLIGSRPWTGYGIENLHIPFAYFFTDDMLEVLGQVYIFDKAHNEYLNIAVSSGIPSLIIYLALIMQILQIGSRRIKHIADYWPLLAAVAGYLVQAFFNISVVSVAYIFWVFLGLVSGYEANPPRNPR